jgi:hypothetical protein
MSAPYGSRCRERYRENRNNNSHHKIEYYGLKTRQAHLNTASMQLAKFKVNPIPIAVVPHTPRQSIGTWGTPRTGHGILSPSQEQIEIGSIGFGLRFGAE